MTDLEQALQAIEHGLLPVTAVRNARHKKMDLSQRMAVNDESLLFTLRSRSSSILGQLFSRSATFPAQALIWGQFLASLGGIFHNGLAGKPVIRL